MTEYIYEHKPSGADHMGNPVELPMLVQREEIVRCRDCVNCYFDISAWMCGEFGFDVGNEDDGEPDGFCAWAVKRTGAKNG